MKELDAIAQKICPKYLAAVSQNKKLRQKVYDIIIEISLDDEAILPFWDHKLSYCGIY